MSDGELGRWTCSKCGRWIVAAGPHSKKGLGAYTGPCPWDCGAWVNRGFRFVVRGQVKAYRAQEWDTLEDGRRNSAMSG